MRKVKSETLRNMPKVPQVESIRTRIQIQGCVSRKAESAGCAPVLNTGASSWIVTVIGSHQKFTVNFTQAGPLFPLHTIPEIYHVHQGRWFPIWGIEIRETKTESVTV